jgi:hypothetical protein
MSQLRTCPHCSRHHRVCEPLCPFCGGALPSCSAELSTSPRERMSRAMLVAAGAALLGGAGCETSILPAYGIAPHPLMPDASADTADAAQAATAGDATAADEGGQGDDAPDGGDR